MTGTISKYFPDRHYGFLVADDGQNLFFHEVDTTGFATPIDRGIRVTFEVVTFRDRPKAVCVAPFVPKGNGGAQ